MVARAGVATGGLLYPGRAPGVKSRGWRGGRTEPGADPVSPPQLQSAGRGICVQRGQRDDDSAKASAQATRRPPGVPWAPIPVPDLAHASAFSADFLC